MFIQRTQRKGSNGKVYKSVSLMENYREGKKVKHRIISTLTKWPEKLIADFGKLLKGNKIDTVEGLQLSNGKSFGALKAVLEASKALGIAQALGSGKAAKLALFQIAGRAIAQGSRNYLANEWAKGQAVGELLKLSDFSENDLYSNLDWLAENQSEIEKKIFAFRHKNKKANDIFLYDVTSSYFEGQQNELAKYGYNRDKKKGKKQIVIGLMLDSEGYPLTVEVFEGNTSDTKTVSSQLKKLKKNFGAERAIFVGDKGMVKSGQIDEISSDEYKWNYLTTITRQQINSLMGKGLIQISMFDSDLVEVEGEGGERYILRKNWHRAKQLKQSRDARAEALEALAEDRNRYLKGHKRAKLDVALRKVNEKAGKLNLSKIINIEAEGRQIKISIDKEKSEKQAELDGCYVIKTDVPKSALPAREAHSRYKDLSKVEFAFRTMKTTIEEMRPIFVRKESRTRGHVFVAMLAYMAIKHITDKIENLGYSRSFAIESLDKIQYINYQFEGREIKVKPKNLAREQSEILAALGIKL